ncbi:MAG TPA: dihydrofolate reductase [Rhizomicrobium sp.]|jgi:dihydrofolate reductase
MTHITLVLAMADNGTIGDANSIPWRLPEDMRRFKSLTLGKPVIMGRKTWESLPKKPLPGRTNIVVTRDGNYHAEGATIATTLEAAIARAKEEGAQEIMIIGGAEIYRASLTIATRIELTEVHAHIEGDTKFPLDRTPWHETAREDHKTDAGLGYSFVTLQRTNN